MGKNNHYCQFLKCHQTLPRPLRMPSPALWSYSFAVSRRPNSAKLTSLFDMMSRVSFRPKGPDPSWSRVCTTSKSVLVCFFGLMGGWKRNDAPATAMWMVNDAGCAVAWPSTIDYYSPSSRSYYKIASNNEASSSFICHLYDYFRENM